MKRLLLLVSLCCAVTTATLSQENLKSWDSGPLTWDDFSLLNSKVNEKNSYLEFLLVVEERPFTPEGYPLMYPEVVAMAYMDKNLSWAVSSSCSPDELRYNQVMFNIVELYRRKLQLAIDTGDFNNLDYHIRLLSHVVDSFSLSTDNGADIVAVGLWGSSVRRQLDSIAPILIDKHGRKKYSRDYVITHSWEKGPLTWKNFTPVEESIGDEHSYLDFSLEIENRRQDIDGIKWPVTTAVAKMYRQRSWVDRRHRTPAQLRYNQVLFNLAELYRRHLQVAIDTGGRNRPDSVLAKIKDEYMQYLTYEAEHYCRSTRYGADTNAVAWWDYEVRQRMDSITPLMVESHAPAFVLPNYSLPYVVGTNIGMGFKYFGGGLQPLFAPSGGYYWDFEVGYSRHILTLGMYIGGGRCKPDTLYAVNSKNNLYSSDNILTLDLSANYGFAVVDSRKLRIMPFVGYGMQGLFYSEENQTSGGPIEGCWRAGVDVKYHFSNEYEATQRVLEQYLVSVDAKIFVERDRFNSLVDTPRGYTLNLSLGFSLTYKEGKSSGVKK